MSAHPWEAAGHRPWLPSNQPPRDGDPELSSRARAMHPQPGQENSKVPVKRFKMLDSGIIRTSVRWLPISSLLLPSQQISSTASRQQLATFRN